ncbi:LysR family transcriptional regulator [Ramlibacter sp. AN1015]|uniref:LysR family transcriptional regulator n=1 Tax=Ramlibacter sp. AN1015 TaxID=3133428 RepID=UPI0030C181C3
MVDTLLRMRLFVAVYEERSFTAAAARENATQSGVTQHIRKLEDQFGITLFVRTSTSVTPTPIADTYYAGCIEVLRAHEQTRHNLRAQGSQLSGEVIVGLTPTMTRSATAPALASFKASHPNVIVRVIDAYSDIVAEKVRAGELDFGVVPGFTPETGMRSTLFARTPEFLVSGPRSGVDLPHRAPVELGKISALRMVMPSPLQARRRHLETYIVSTGARVVERIEIDSALAARDFVAHTRDWVSVHPGISMLEEYAHGPAVVNPLVNPPLMLELFRIERARHPLAPPAIAFARTLQAETVKLQDEAIRMLRAEPEQPARRRSHQKK